MLNPPLRADEVEIARHVHAHHVVIDARLAGLERSVAELRDRLGTVEADPSRCRARKPETRGRGRVEGSRPACDAAVHAAIVSALGSADAALTPVSLARKIRYPVGAVNQELCRCLERQRVVTRDGTNRTPSWRLARTPSPTSR
jgi:hypothetical protein